MYTDYSSMHIFILNLIVHEIKQWQHSVTTNIYCVSNAVALSAFFIMKQIFMLDRNQIYSWSGHGLTWKFIFFFE